MKRRRIDLDSAVLAFRVLAKTPIVPLAVSKASGMPSGF